MENNMTTIKASCPDLFQSPHILRELTTLLFKEWRLDSSELERLAEHLMLCSDCRTALIVLLFGERYRDKEQYSSKKDIHSLIRQFVAIHQGLHMQNEEELGAYAEMIVTTGKEEANKSFSLVAEHVTKCSHCQSILKDILDFLHESEAPG